MSNADEAREQIKIRLLKQYKMFRNFSLKVAVLLGSITFAGHFCYIAMSRDPATLQLEEAFIQSGITSIAFCVLGYCLGSLIGTMMQRQHFSKLEKIKNNRKKSLQDQISIRESRLQSLAEERAVY